MSGAAAAAEPRRPPEGQACRPDPRNESDDGTSRNVVAGDDATGGAVRGTDRHRLVVVNRERLTWGRWSHLPCWVDLYPPRLDSDLRSRACVAFHLVKPLASCFAPALSRSSHTRDRRSRGFVSVSSAG